ncbi:FeoA family protein [Caldisalinibacter kiritimatiensis]|uniref:Ferrous iron transporter FeoA-like domain-containing protein n=1 Tax=Caldisalinibacter kiritimatiensis TaxID=1304284 RepID=R1ASK0_9FIRM|nr:FeoA family protein [Caldisalinibacter kiritimatiensis]EOD00133.1 hypothetical protein L21TH_1784 [Caldisalinibacter kiritimatiensis]
MRALPLNFLNVGEKGIIDTIVGGKKAAKRLIELGLNKGTQVEIVRNEGGRMIVALRGSKIAIGRGVAQKIMVNTVA